MLKFDKQVMRSAWARAAVYLFVLLIAASTYKIRKTLLVFIIAIMFSYLIYPFVELLHRRFWCRSRTVALLIPFVSLICAIVAAALLIREPVSRQVTQLKQQVTRVDFVNKVESWRPLDLPVGEQIVENYKQIFGMYPQMGQQLSRALEAAARDLQNLFLVPLLSFFMLRDSQTLLNGLLKFLRVPPRSAEGLLRDIHLLMLEYMRALSLLCLATLVTFSIVLSVIGVKYAILLSLAAFTLEFVPVVGPICAAVLILGVSEFNGYPHLWWIFFFLIVYRLCQDYVLSPHLMKKGVKLHPLLIIFGVFAGGEIGGVPGIFLSVPALAMIRLFHHEITKDDAERGNATLARAG